MSLTVEDLKPKNFKVNIKGVELDCKPPRLSHALAISKLDNLFKNIDSYNKKQIEQSQIELDEVIGELVPDLVGVELDMGVTINLLSQIMSQIQPSDNKELNDSGVKFDTDPKAGKIG